MSYFHTIPGTSGISSTPVTPLGPATTTSYGARVIYASNGLPVTNLQPVAGLTPGLRDSENRLYVLKDDYIASDDSIRTVSFPINPRAFLTAGVDDGIAPRATPPVTPNRRRVIRETAGGWPAGRIIEDRALFGPTGDLAIDTIPSSIVSAVTGQQASAQKTDDNPWPMRAAVAAGLLLAIAFIVNSTEEEQEEQE